MTAWHRLSTNSRKIFFDLAICQAMHFPSSQIYYGWIQVCTATIGLEITCTCKVIDMILHTIWLCMIYGDSEMKPNFLDTYPLHWRTKTFVGSEAFGNDHRGADAELVFGINVTGITHVHLCIVIGHSLYHIDLCGCNYSSIHRVESTSMRYANTKMLA